MTEVKDVRMAPDTSRLGRLQRLKDINASKSYLEVGVFKGAVFLNIGGLARKVAVDPKFQFDVGKAKEDKTQTLHEVTSDRYFSGIAAEDEKFDLIYLDGLHTFEQTFRDFCCAVSLMKDDSICLIDDTVPLSMAQAHPDQRMCARLKPTCKDDTNMWMGDVFKLVYAIHDFFPQFSFATFPGHGQTVVWKQRRASFKPLFNDMEKISRLDYGQFVLGYRDVFNVKDADAIFADLRRWQQSRRKAG